MPTSLPVLAPAILAVSLILATACSAQDGPPPLGHTDALVVTALPANPAAGLGVTSPAFASGGQIPFENTQYRGNIFPGLKWTAGPAATQSYLVVVQSGISRAGGKSSIHLTLYNIPAGVTQLDTGMTAPPNGATLGPNVHGLSAAYAGPHTHSFVMETYYFEVLALDATLPATPDQSFEAIEAAARGHVLASGYLTGLATMDPTSPEAAKLKGQSQ